jgi:hypothetical protein
VQKNGIEEYIRNKYDEKALQRDDVKNMFRMLNEWKNGRFTD